MKSEINFVNRCAIPNMSLGLTNAITALKNAHMAESPVVLLCGAAPTLLRNRGALQVFLKVIWHAFIYNQIVLFLLISLYFIFC